MQLVQVLTVPEHVWQELEQGRQLLPCSMVVPVGQFGTQAFELSLVVVEHVLQKPKVPLQVRQLLLHD
jgi:hypothetical protein